MPPKVSVETPADLRSEDYRGRIQEIQQIVSHRFQICTLAIVVFSAVCGWLTISLARLDTSNSGIVRQPAFQLAIVSLLLIIVIAILYYEYFALHRILRIFSTYLVVKYNSEWERDWKAYRSHPETKKYPGYSASGYRIFSWLTVLSVIYPFVLLLTFGTDVTFEPITFLFLAPITASVVVLRFIHVRTFQLKRFVKEEALLEGWNKVVESTKIKDTVEGKGAGEHKGAGENR